MFEIIALVLIVICIGNPMYALVIVPGVVLFFFVAWKIANSNWPSSDTEPEGNGDDDDHCDGCCGHH